MKVENCTKNYFIFTFFFQVFVVSLVVLDTLIVITELLIDLELAGKDSQVPYILHSISISLLCLFVVEIFFKIYAFKMEYFSMKVS